MTAPGMAGRSVDRSMLLFNDGGNSIAGRGGAALSRPFGRPYFVRSRAGA
jgi:hypothetical protein